MENVTKGKIFIDEETSPGLVYIDRDQKSICIVQSGLADATLIAEALTVHTETGLSPKEMQERISKLEKALKGLLLFAEQYGPSERANYEDWSGHFDDANKALSPPVTEGDKK